MKAHLRTYSMLFRVLFYCLLYPVCRLLYPDFYLISTFQVKVFNTFLIFFNFPFFFQHLFKYQILLFEVNFSSAYSSPISSYLFKITQLKRFRHFLISFCL